MTADDTNPVPAELAGTPRFPRKSRVWVATTGSTNADVLGWAASDSAPGAVLVTDHQTAGRGRLDRTWEDQTGDSLLVSFLIDGDEVNGLVPLVLGVAALEVVHKRGGMAAGLKWPNDLMVGTKKLAGILVEVAHGDGRIIGAAAGIGMNLRTAPDGAISLATLTGSIDDDVIGVTGVLDDLCASFDEWLTVIQPGGGSRSRFVDAYRERCLTVGQRVRVDKTDGTSFEGDATGIDDEGRLVVAHDGGSVVVQAGDVHHLRPA